jgi:hypothetical protein
LFPVERRLRRLAVPVGQHEVDDGNVNCHFADAIHGTSYRCTGCDDFGAGSHQQSRVIHRDHRFVFGDQDALTGESVELQSHAFLVWESTVSVGASLGLLLLRGLPGLGNR